MKRIVLFLALIGASAPLAAMDQQGYTPIHEAHRGYSDYIPFDIAYIPSLLSVRHQMAKYGIAKQDGTGYEFAQLSNPVYQEVKSLLKELNFEDSSIYILKLNPQVSGNATSVLITNSCIFIDEAEWLTLNTPEMRAHFENIAQEQGRYVADPVRTIKKYILKRAITHFNNGTYRTKVASKLIVGAVLAVIVHKTMAHVTDFAAQQDQSLGVTQAVCNAAPALASACSAVCIPGLLKFAGSLTLSSIIGDQLRGIMHSIVTRPFWRQLDTSAEQEVIAAEPEVAKKFLVSYNKHQATLKANNPVLSAEYDWRAQFITGALKHQ
ncbi:MAG: hypothetical protein AB7F19_01180 [Candidatus Babeliales bacterium]